MKDSILYGKKTDPKLALSVQLWPFFSSWRWPKSKKISSSAEKRQSLSYLNMSKWSLYLISFFGKNTITFCNIWDIFTKETGRGHNSKEQNQNLTNTILSTRFLVNFLYKSVGSNIFLFCGYRSQRTFRKIFTRIFKFAWFSWYHSYIA